MSIKITKRTYPTDVKTELEILLGWVISQSPQTVYDLREVILNIIRVISNSVFRGAIALLRQKYQVPTDFYKYPRNKDDKYENWLNDHADQVPVDPWDKRLAEVCQKHQLNPDKYGEFILNYLFFGEVFPVGELVTLENELSVDEPRYKARISIHKDKDPQPEGAYIRLYKDTTKNQLHEYIEKNWQIISFLQQFLTPFPATRNRKAWLFKRDLVIYLYHSLGKNTPEILDEIDRLFISDQSNSEKIDRYTPADSNIRKIASDFHKDIQQSSDI